MNYRTTRKRVIPDMGSVENSVERNFCNNSTDRNCPGFKKSEGDECVHKDPSGICSADLSER